jgi:mannose PTS system EIIA component
VIGLILVSHGKLAEGLLDAMQMITGEQEAVRAIGLLETEDVEGLLARINQAVEEVDGGEGALILVDLFGASPFNASARLYLSHPDRQLEVVTGMNLPMLVELAVNREGMTVEEASQLAIQVGQESLRRLSDSEGFKRS